MRLALPGTALAEQLYVAAQGRGLGQKGTQSLIAVLAGLLGRRPGAASGREPEPPHERRRAPRPCAARLCADAAISCVEAAVCSVAAETCSADALEDSATPATSATSMPARSASAEICCDRGGDLADPRADVLDRAPDRLERVARALHGGDALVRALGAVGDDADDAPGLRWISLDEAGDLAGGGLGLLGELADLLGDDREAAALLAGARRLDRGVQRQQVGLVGDRR